MDSKITQTSAGQVTWDKLKSELMSLPKEDIIDMVDLWVRTYWTLQNYWMICIERDFGFDNTARLDGEIWGHLAKAQAHRLKKVLNLGNDVQSLATLLKYCAAQWVNAGFTWEFVEITPTRLFMRVNQCPMGTYRTAQDLPLIPCKLGASSLYEYFSKVINEKFQVTCRHAHPDPKKDNTMCEWEFVLTE
jgi:hypothetical protein